MVENLNQSNQQLLQIIEEQRTEIVKLQLFNITYECPVSQPGEYMSGPISSAGSYCHKNFT
jgi:hypothetical protein